jgi:hypothetical protein
MTSTTVAHKHWPWHFLHLLPAKAEGAACISFVGMLPPQLCTYVWIVVQQAAKQVAALPAQQSVPAAVVLHLLCPSMLKYQDGMLFGLPVGRPLFCLNCGK